MRRPHVLALNQLSGANLGACGVGGLAAGIGSDCPLFLEGGPVIMRGRGERIESLPDPAARPAARAEGAGLQAEFGVSTAWAYERMAANGPQSYLPAQEAERRIAAWLGGDSMPGVAVQPIWSR